MVRFGTTRVRISNSYMAIAVSASFALVSSTTINTALAQDSQTQLDSYLLQIEKLISDNDLEGARDKLTEAQAANLRDESLDLIQGQLRLLESLNQASSVAAEPAIVAAEDGSTGLTELDKSAATDLLDSLRVAMENGELDKVRLFTTPTPRTNSLLNAVFDNYAAMRVEVSPPEADEKTQSFLATLEFKELTTKNGDTAFPAQAWKTHRLRIIKSDGSWQKVLW